MKYFSLSLFAVLTLAACTSLPSPTSSIPTVANVQAQYSLIRFVVPTGHGYPEGVAWHATKQAFVVSSLRHGTIGLVDLQGNYRVLSDDPSLISTAGIVVDVARGRILVTNADVGVSHKSTESTKFRTAQVVELDMNSGQIRHIYDFKHLSQGATLSNDLTFDKAGNTYVTDSFQPQIYKVNQADKSVSVLVRDDRLKPNQGGESTGLLPNLNGIVYHNDGYLLAGDYVQEKLWKIPLANPTALQEVKLPNRLKGPDGLVMIDDNTIALIQTASNGDVMESYISYLRTTDNWQSVTMMTEKRIDGINGLTTGTLKEGVLWAVNSHYPNLFGNEKADELSQFELMSVMH